MLNSTELKMRYKRICNEIRKVIIEFWDPMNIKNAGSTGNEYDGYIGGIYDLLMEHASGKKIANHLSLIEKNYMGYEATPQSLLAIAKELIKIDVK